MLWAMLGAVLPIAALGGVSSALPIAHDASGPPATPEIQVEHALRFDDDPPVRFGPSVDPVLLTAMLPANDTAAPPRPAVEDEEAREIFYGDTSRRAVALTFDDGPSRQNTPRILDVLAKYDVQATFFVLGGRADKMPDLIARIDAEGHELGNHTWSHPSMRSLWPSAMREELETTNAKIAEITGKHPTMVRPPYGRYPPSALPVFTELKLDAVLWSVDSADWELDDPQAIAHKVVWRATPGSIILLHDRTAATTRALPDIIRGLRDRDFEIVPVSDLTGLAPYRDPAVGRTADHDVPRRSSSKSVE